MATTALPTNRSTFTRVQLPAEATRTATFSAGSEADLSLGGTLLLTTQPEVHFEEDDADHLDMEQEDLKTIVARMESLQSLQRSVQQPNPELDAMILKYIGNRPERRQRLAVMTKSALLRKKILSLTPQGGRGNGSAVLGSTHPWRESKLPRSMSDCNWPQVVHNEHGIHHLPGTDPQHGRLLRCPADKIPHHPTLSQSPFYSVPQAQRFFNTLPNGEIDKDKAQLRSSPGPGAYSKSLPRGAAFSVDGGETVILGANHSFPWKKCLGQQVNPIHSEATTLPSAPCYTMSKSRRMVSETGLGHIRQDGGPVKSDLGNLSPGFVYETYSSMQPWPNATLDGTKSKRRLRIRKSASMPRIRKIPMPPEASASRD